jgi:hypothetical protein
MVFSVGFQRLYWFLFFMPFRDLIVIVMSTIRRTTAIREVPKVHKSQF